MVATLGGPYRLLPQARQHCSTYPELSLHGQRGTDVPWYVVRNHTRSLFPLFFCLFFSLSFLFLGASAAWLARAIFPDTNSNNAFFIPRGADCLRIASGNQKAQSAALLINKTSTQGKKNKINKQNPKRTLNKVNAKLCK